MPAYMVALIDLKKPDEYEEYRKLAGIAMPMFGGKFLARGGKHDIFEGNFTGNRVVIVEFPTLEKARAFYDSPEYKRAIAARAGKADFLTMVAVDGA